MPGLARWHAAAKNLKISRCFGVFRINCQHLLGTHQCLIHSCRVLRTQRPDCSSPSKKADGKAGWPPEIHRLIFIFTQPKQSVGEIVMEIRIVGSRAIAAGKWGIASDGFPDRSSCPDDIVADRAARIDRQRPRHQRSAVCPNL